MAVKDSNELADREDNLPPVHGRWIWKDGMYCCSKCGGYSAEHAATPFCPWCGMIMSIRESG